MSYTVLFDESTFGITAKSLKMLRNTLAERFNHRIAVIEVPTDQICCGFLLLDQDTREAVFTGDGFRTDGAGEGGAGYKSARAYLDLFGMPSRRWVATLNIWDQDTVALEGISGALLRLVDEVRQSLTDGCYVSPADTAPGYLR